MPRMRNGHLKGLKKVSLILVAVVATTAPFADFYQAKNFASFSWAPHPDFTEFWCAVVLVVIADMEFVEVFEFLEFTGLGI